MLARRLILISASVLVLAACSQSEPALNASGTLRLDGPIPDCLTLTAPGQREYRIEARRECLAQPSLDARLKSKGCLIQQEIGNCQITKEADANGYTSETASAERAAARQH